MGNIQWDILNGGENDLCLDSLQDHSSLKEFPRGVNEGYKFQRAKLFYPSSGKERMNQIIHWIDGNWTTHIKYCPKTTWTHPKTSSQFHPWKIRLKTTWVQGGREL